MGRPGAAVFACVLALTSARASAQPQPVGRVAIEAVAAVASTSQAADDPFVWLDLATTVRVGHGVDVVIPPYARRLPGGDWDALLYQAQIRYQPTETLRIDAGVITSPIGLGTLELRPDLNPVVSYPFYYFSPLPRFDQFANQVQVLSGGYPLGALVSWSQGPWDARAGVTDGTPTRSRDVFEAPSPMPQFVAGGGVTPITGLRIGAGLAAGKYRASSETDFFSGAVDTGPVTNANALVFNLEGEYAFRYTRISGEWIRDRFETDTGNAVSYGYFVQGVQTLTPRWFAATRLTGASAPVRLVAALTQRTRSAAEVTAGFRLTPTLTLKAGYQAARAYGSTDWSHAAVWSAVWSQRWF
jgi:hypothetical protein